MKSYKILKVRLPIDERRLFEEYSLERTKPFANTIMYYGILCHGICLITRSVMGAPKWSVIIGIALILMMAAIARITCSLKAIDWHSYAAVTFIFFFSIGNIFNSVGLERPISWVLPAIISVSLCVSPFWVSLKFFIIGAVSCWTPALIFASYATKTREDTVETVLYAVSGLMTSYILHIMYNAIRTDQFFLERKLENLASRDPLTGIPNRRKFMESAEKEIQSNKSACTTLTILFLDVDNFKSINDEFGHEVGDSVLQQVGKALSGNVLGNIYGRLGGEEFSVMHKAIDPDSAIRLAENIRKAILRIPLINGNISVSIGVSQVGPDYNLADALRRADEAMLRAKRNGKNRVEVSFTC